MVTGRETAIPMWAALQQNLQFCNEKLMSKNLSYVLIIFWSEGTVESVHM